MDVTINIAAAVLCIAQQCFPVLIGKDTPVGEFTVIKREVLDPNYRGHILQFKETENEVFAIHRIWNGKPQQKRFSRIKSNNPSDRFITGGCVNVEDDLFELLTTNHQDLRLTINK